MIFSINNLVSNICDIYVCLIYTYLIRCVIRIERKCLNFLMFGCSVWRLARLKWLQLAYWCDADVPVYETRKSHRRAAHRWRFARKTSRTLVACWYLSNFIDTRPCPAALITRHFGVAHQWASIALRFAPYHHKRYINCIQ